MRNPFRNRDKPRNIASNQPDTFVMAVDKYHSHPEYKTRITYSPKLGHTPSFVAEMTLRDIDPVKDSMESFLQESYGGGTFFVAIMNAAKHELCSYSFNIANAPLYKPYKSASGGEQDGEKRRKAGGVQDLVELAGAIKALQPEPDTTLKELAIKLIEGQMSGSGSDADAMLKEMFQTFYNNSLTQKENEMGRIRDMMEIGKMMTPQIPAEDTTTALINALPSLAGLFMAAKGGGGASGNGGMNAQVIQSLAQLAKFVPPEKLQSLPPEARAALGQITGASAPLNAGGANVHPRPGDPSGSVSSQQPLPGEIGEGAAGPLPKPPAAPIPRTHSNIHHQAIDAVIEEIRADLRGEVGDDVIARKMISLIEYARSFTKADPHPMLKGMMESTAETADREFLRLCAAIPEFQRDPDRIDKVAAQIFIAIAAGAASAFEQMEGQEEMEGEPEFEFDTQAEERERESGRAGEREGEKAGQPEGGKAGEPEGGKAGEPEGERAGEPEGEKAGQPEGGKAGEPEGGKAGEPEGERAEGRNVDAPESARLPTERAERESGADADRADSEVVDAEPAASVQAV